MLNRPSAANDEFSLVLGGPLYQLLLRAGLARPTLELLHRRIAAFVLVTWLPLALLTLLSGNFLGAVSVPFLYDLDAHVRFLAGLPLLIGAELLVHRRLRVVVGQFFERGLVAPEDRQAFENILAGAMRMRNSALIEVLLLVLSWTGGHWLWQTHLAVHAATWYAAPAGDGAAFTGAGYWYAFVSLPIARFILLRWYFRLVIWYVFLFRVSRLNLRLNPLHPDRAGGLGFLGASVDAIAPVLIAQSAFVAGLIGNRIWHAHATLPEFKLEIIAVVAFLMLIVLAPLTFFAFHMAAARRAGLREFGALAASYAGEFRQKWVSGEKQPDEPLLGSADIQSLADLGNSYDIVREMGYLPFGRSAVIRLAMLIALPMLPLALTMIPFEEMVDRLIRMLI